MWYGYTRPIVTSATLDAPSLTLHLIGTALAQTLGPTSVEIWRKLDETPIVGANPNDGTRHAILVSQSVTDTDIVASVPQEVIDNANAYIVKVAIKNGPRSKAVALTSY
jgi:hypothetical protein